jgi:hypothetical protein
MRMAEEDRARERARRDDEERVRRQDEERARGWP